MLKENLHSTSFAQEKSTRYKMYKSGKLWVTSGLSILALSGVLAISQTNASADTVSAAPEQTTVVTKGAVTETATDNSIASSTKTGASAQSQSVTANVGSNASLVSPTSQNVATLPPVSEGAASASSLQVASSANESAQGLPATQATSGASAALNATAQTDTKDIELLATPTVTSADVQQAVNTNIKDNVTVPASYLANANPDGSGPFTAGVNQVIPFNAFGGDGMLTRLLLNASDGAPWSDNGTAKNAALLPISENADQFTYEVDLNGNTTGKTGADLIAQLKANGKMAYNATVKVYSKADPNTVVATKNVTVNLASLTDGIKDSVTVPASYLANANPDGSGPFTAGVNQVIP
ncbi:SSURE domain-containing protein, partial [Furfurilactobacillus sp. WILCCON 0119]